MKLLTVVTLLAAALLPGAAASAEVPKVLLSDFSREHDGEAALIQALADYEARRVDPAARLRTGRIDSARAAEVLRAARALER